MNLFTKLAMFGGLGLMMGIGCTTKPKEITPARAGDRNDNCQAKNDCNSGLSCIGGRCQPTNYDNLEVSGKECIRHQCDETEDCCGDKPTDAPAKCAGVESICLTPTVPGCSPSSYCTDDDQCGSGTCEKALAPQRCSITQVNCTGSTDCYDEVCEQNYYPYYGSGGGGYTIGTCSRSNTSCDEDSDCPYFGDSCPDAIEQDYGQCDCTNPDYDPTDEICSDEDCEDVCSLVCENNLCVEDDSCEDDNECPSSMPFCDDGECVPCTADDECDEDAEEECREGACVRPCEFDQECGSFSECQKGECVYVGCESDTDCVLYYTESETARLAVCVVESDLGTCRLPCDTDAHCGSTSICSDGFCEYIGCQTDAQCDRLLNLDNQQVTADKPYVTQGRCVDVEDASADSDEDSDE